MHNVFLKRQARISTNVVIYAETKQGRKKSFKPAMREDLLETICAKS